MKRLWFALFGTCLLLVTAFGGMTALARAAPAPAPTGSGVIGLTGTPDGPFAVDLSWTNPAGTTDVLIYAYATDCLTLLWGGEIAEGAGPNSYTEGAITSGSYCFGVAASQDGGATWNWSYVEASTGPFGPWSGITVTAVTTTTMTISWTTPWMNQTPYSFSFTLFPAGCVGDWLDYGGTYEGAIVPSEYVFSGLASNTTYCVDFDIGYWNGTSPIVWTNGTTLNAVVSTVPDAPSGLTSITGEPSTIGLTWVPPPGNLTDTHIYVYNVSATLSGISGSCTHNIYETIDVGAALFNYYVVTGLPIEINFCFTVSASNAYGEGPQSAVTFVPGAPTHMAITAINDTALYLTWDNPSQSTTNNVYVFMPDCVTQIRHNINVGDVTNYTLTGLSPGTQYCIGVTDTVYGIQSPDPSVFGTTGGNATGGGGLLSTGPNWVEIGFLVFLGLAVLIVVLGVTSTASKRRR